MNSEMKGVEGQNDIRVRLRAVYDDPTLSSAEKNRLSQEILSQTNPTPATSSILTSNYAKECAHYKKSCSNFVFDCCHVTDPCNRCHLARECCTTKPPRITAITCNECDTVQPPSEMCTNCSTQFSKSYCDKCKIWTALEIHHCDECGICRVGKPGTNFHCKTCDACFALENRDSHICALKSIKDESCPYCLEPLHTSQQQGIILTCCKIVVHSACQTKACGRGLYRCPNCRKSQYDMTSVWREIRRSIAAQPIPPELLAPITVGTIVRCAYGVFRIESEYQSSDNSSAMSSEGRLYSGRLLNWTLARGTSPRATLHGSCFDQSVRLVEAWCNDCEDSCHTPFHYAGLECAHCGGYNTFKS